MQNDNKNPSSSYSVPKKIVNKVQQATIENTQEQVAHSQLMVRYYRHRQEEATDKAASGKFGMQADQLEAGLDLNIQLLAWLEKGG